MPPAERISMKTFALIVFAVTYAGMLLLPRWRAPVALTAAAAFLISGLVPLQAVPDVVDWNVLGMLAGTMGTVFLFIRSGTPARLADRMVLALPDVRWILVSLALFAGLVSAFIDNVATVLMLAPIGLAIAKRLNISPVAPVLAIAISSNLQGAATLVGDTTSILLGSYVGMDFADFFVWHGRPGMFWVVQAGALATIPVLMYLFRGERGKAHLTELTPVTDYVPTALLLGTVAALIVASFFPEKPEATNGILCLLIFFIGLVWDCVKNQSTDVAREAILSIDYTTLLLLAGLFIVIDGISRAGVIKDISSMFVRLGGESLFLTYTMIVWFSVLISAFVDNIPYVAAMLPVVGGIVSAMGGTDGSVLYFGLLAGATLGGNLTPIGASANIAAGGILRKEGYPVSLKEFLRMGVPFTLTAVTTGYVLIWLLYA